MKKYLIALVVLTGLVLPGCYKLVAEHPEKTENQFYEDQAACEEKAREYARERREEVSLSGEINHARRCMRDLGWEYYFRKAGK